jgi:proline iminopeptidase
MLVLGAVLATACETLAPGEAGNLVPKTVAEDPTLPAIDMNGSRFHVETRGNPSNPVVIILHGGPGIDYRGMLRLADRHNGYSLVDDYFLVFWDQRGTGLSKRHNRAEVSQELYVSDLDSLIERYSPGRPAFLVGHSWGGMYATLFINERPSRVAGAVLIETAPLTAALMEARIADINPMNIGSERINDIVWHSQFFTPDDHARMDYERTIGMRNAQPKFHVSEVDPAPGWRMGAAVSEWLVDEIRNDKGKFDFDFTTNLSAFTTPVLFIAGGLSEVVGPSLQLEQMPRYPSATLQVIEGVGHELQWERAAETVTLVRAYLTARGAN